MAASLLRMFLVNIMTAGVGWLGWRIGMSYYRWLPMRFGEAVLATTLVWMVVFAYGLATEKDRANERR